MSKKNGTPADPDKVPPQRHIPGTEVFPISNPPNRPANEPPTDEPNGT